MATITCPKCGTENPADAMNCKNCRINLKFALEHPDMFGPGKQEAVQEIPIPKKKETSASPIEQQAPRRGEAALAPSKMDVEEKNADEWCQEGNTLVSRGQYDEALACLEKALKIDPQHALTWFNMGLTLMNLGRKDEAINAFETFIKHAPPEAQALHVPVAKGYIQMLRAGAGAGVIYIDFLT